MELGTENVVIECDFMLTVQAICKDKENFLEVDNLLQESHSHEGSPRHFCLVN